VKRKRRGSTHPQFDSSDPLLDATAVDELDLHGYTSDDARGMVQGFLEGCRRRGGGVVKIITGRGRGSAGRPVLRGVVTALLKGPLRPLVAEWAEDDSGGGFKVRVR
jgi:DNA-nicking Smr family endonuclease